jgi:hypothetical protein
MIRSLIKDYGVTWLFHRSLYFLKLKGLLFFPKLEVLFEKKILIKRVDIYKCKNIKNLEIFLNELSEKEKVKIIKEAEKILIGKIKAFSFLELDYGNPIEWNKNPFTNQKFSLKDKWYKIPDFDKEKGDIKVIWEPSRMSQLLKLARAYILTKDKKYYLNFSFQIKDWYKKNSYSHGPNYKCGQENALRMINIIIAADIFRKYALLTEEDEKYIKNILRDSYKKILSNFYYAKNCIKNNHTISELVGLIVGAWCSEDKKMVKKYFKDLEEELDNQFLNDGGYIQFSFNYQRLVLQLMEFIISIKNELNLEFSDKILEKLKRSILLLNNLINENGDVPNYGSNDGALIFPVTSCNYRDFRPIINTLYYLLEKEILFKKDLFTEEIYWFSSIEEKDLELRKERIISKESKKYNESGLYTLVNNKESFMMIVAQDLKLRPSQMDQFHIDLWHNNINILCDTGSYSYASELGKKLSSTQGHNTLKVENIEQMNKRGAFLIYDWIKLEEIEWDTKKFKGKYYSKNGYIHQRNINLKNNEYLIEDRVRVKRKELIGKKVELILNTPCEIILKEKEIELLYKGKKVASILTNERKVIDTGIRSLYYLEKEDINVIKLVQKLEEENKFYYKIKLY